VFAQAQASDYRAKKERRPLKDVFDSTKILVSGILIPGDDKAPRVGVNVHIAASNVKKLLARL
jgi:hypothetical protein